MTKTTKYRVFLTTDAVRVLECNGKESYMRTFSTADKLLIGELQVETTPYFIKWLTDWVDVDAQTNANGLLKTEAPLVAFANELIAGASEGGSFDGGDIQEVALRHGLLKWVVVDSPCREDCVCDSLGGFPTKCYQKSQVLKCTLD